MRCVVYIAEGAGTKVGLCQIVNRKTANSVDGYVSDKDIAEVFANKYRQIFTSAKSDDLELEKTLELINNRLHSETLPDHSVYVGDVIKAIQRLKFNKGDGMKGTVSDLFIHATHRFTSYSMLC